MAIRSVITLLAVGCVIYVVFLVLTVTVGEVDLSTVRQRARAVHAGISST